MLSWWLKGDRSRPEMDVIDLRLVRALQLAPRASFARIADAIGVHERTAARRYRRLRREGVVCVIGAVNPAVLGHHYWQVRIRCRPDVSESLAAGLAAREDVAWVGVAAAGSEVSASVRSLSPQQRELLLTRLLPRSAHVLAIEVSVVLHVFTAQGSRGWSMLENVLTPPESANLIEAETSGPESRTVHLEPPDVAMAAVVAADGRASIARLAEAAGLSQGRTTRRLDELLRTRALVIDVDLNHGALGFPVGAQFYLAVTPACLQQVGRDLAEFPEAGFVAAMSGRDNLIASVACRDLAHLYDLATARIGALEGITAMEIVPFSRVVKQGGRTPTEASQEFRIGPEGRGPRT
ncbi:Lrp/AsnC family transcriptional regulator [Sinomonas atrocyanea]